MRQVVTTLSALLISTVAGSAMATCSADTSQADFQAGIANSLDLTTSPDNVLLAQSGGGGGGGATLDQQNTTLTSSGEVFSNTQWNAQTFTAGASGSLTRVDLNLFCYLCSTAPPSIIVSIRATSGGLPTGSDLAVTSGTINSNGVPTFYTFNFTTPATVSSGTQYAIVIRAASAPTSGKLAFTNSATSSVQGNDVYRGGSLQFSTNSGSSWSVQTYGTTPTSDGGFKTYVGGGGGTGYVSAGDLVSRLKDSAPPAGSTPTWGSFLWTVTTPAGTAVKFQAAASNDSAGPFTFVGPDGTANTFFTSGSSLSQFNGNRYLKYHAFLSTTSSGSTPVLADATVCYSSVTSNADLSITNTDGVTSAAPGGSVTYTIKASNAGPAGATGVNVVDAFPSGLTCSWTCSGAGGGTCQSPSGSGGINQTTVGLPSGASVTYVATCSISASASGTLVNTATVSSTSISDTNTANNTATDSDSLTASTNIALTMTDNVDMVRVGDVVDYVIELTNANGPSSATVSLTDALPAQLTNGSWVCTASNGAACGSASGSGNKLTDSATVPNGGKVDYLYTATVVSSNANGQVSNTASAKVTSGGNQSAVNLTANDADIVVIFVANFDGGAAAPAPASYHGGGAMTIQLGVDSGLTSTAVGSTPVTIATGLAADGTALFRLQLVRLGGALAMRTLTTLDGGVFSDVAPWSAVNLKNGALDLTWQPATARGDDGFLRAGSLPLSATNARAGLATLQTATEHGVPWVVAIGR